MRQVKLFNPFCILHLCFYMSITISLAACGGGGGGNNSDNAGNNKLGSNTAVNPSLTVTKTINGSDSANEEILSFNVDDLTNNLFTVTNAGNVTLDNVEVFEAQLKPQSIDAEPVCQQAVLAPEETLECSTSGFVIEGEYESRVEVTAFDPNEQLITAFVQSRYIGIDPDELAALPQADVTQGEAPLTVNFTPDANTENAILVYEWDFDGDGTDDRSETVGRTQQFVYREVGIYNAQLRITDANGEQATAVVEITVENAAPVVTLEASPSNGPVPLQATLIATATDTDGIESFEWDFDGDGAYDETTAVGSVRHLYSTTGSFIAAVRVTDTAGIATVATSPTLIINALPEGSPSVSLRLNASSNRRAPLDVGFSARATGSGLQQYEWDTDGDGTFDQTTLTGSIPAVTYTIPGKYYPRVRVTTENGLTAEDVVELDVVADPALQVLETDTVDPLNGESAIIETTLNGDMDVSLVIESAGGQLVRTLFDFTNRLANTYQDSWDGRNDTGNVVTEGDYRAILLYKVDDIVQRLDLSATTGGRETNPPRTPIPSTFSPFAGDPLVIEFTLSEASDVTAFMGLFRTNTRLVTFLQREPFGRGTHQIVWNGENSDGQLIESPPNDSFLFGIFSYELPDNAIYIRSGSHVETLTAQPSILQPTQTTDATSRIAVTLDRPGSVQLTINDVDSGVRVFEQRFDNLEAGANTLSWNGRSQSSDLVAPGNYRIGAAAIDARGYKSTTVYTLQRVFY